MRPVLLGFFTLILWPVVSPAAPPRVAHEKIAREKVPHPSARTFVADSFRVGSLTLRSCLGGQAYCGSIQRALDPTGQVAGEIKIGFEFYPHTGSSQPPLEAIVDPNEPPMPPKVTAKQAAHFAESLARGTPDRRKIMQTVVQDKVRELL